MGRDEKTRPEFSYSTTSEGAAEIVREVDENYVAGLGAVVAIASLVLLAVWLVAAILSGVSDFSIWVVAIPLGLAAAGGLHTVLRASSGEAYDIERVTVSSAALVHSRNYHGKHAIRTFAAPEINTLRWEQYSHADPSGEGSWPSLEFYYGPETVHMFPNINVLEARKVIGKIADRIPTAVLPYEAWRAARSREA